MRSLAIALALGMLMVSLPQPADAGHDRGRHPGWSRGHHHGWGRARFGVRVNPYYGYNRFYGYPSPVYVNPSYGAYIRNYNWPRKPIKRTMRSLIREFDD